MRLPKRSCVLTLECLEDRCLLNGTSLLDTSIVLPPPEEAPALTLVAESTIQVDSSSATTVSSSQPVQTEIVLAAGAVVQANLAASVAVENGIAADLSGSLVLDLSSATLVADAPVLPLSPVESALTIETDATLQLDVTGNDIGSNIGLDVESLHTGVGGDVTTGPESNILFGPGALASVFDSSDGTENPSGAGYGTLTGEASGTDSAAQHDADAREAAARYEGERSARTFVEAAGLGAEDLDLLAQNLAGQLAEEAGTAESRAEVEAFALDELPLQEADVLDQAGLPISLDISLQGVLGQMDQIAQQLATALAGAGLVPWLIAAAGAITALEVVRRKKQKATDWVPAHEGTHPALQEFPWLPGYWPVAG